MHFTHVDKPIRIGNVEVKNRIFRSPHVTGFANDTDRWVAYHAARAQGGVGLSILEILSVHPTSPAWLNAWAADMSDAYKRLVDACAPHGMKLFQQIWHAGHNVAPIDGSAPWAPSDVAGPGSTVAPIAMTKGMIDEIIGSYVDAVVKCQKWGLDGVEIHAAHGYLPAQFFSPNSNQREDEYGGSFENRSRFTVEIIEACQAATSPDFAIGVRVADDLTEGGVHAADYLRLCQYLEERKLIDFVDISLGNYQNFHKIFSGMHDPVGYELPHSTQISRPLTVPTMVIGRFRTLEEADQVIRAGDADLVGMTRGTIADPDVVRKTLEGHPEQVRPCIGCNQMCLGGLFGHQGFITCTVNAGTGYEAVRGDAMLATVKTAKKVLVIGGGPAGMEAARVAASRGHNVILAEAEPDLGGAVKMAAMAPTRHGMGDITTWLEQEIYRLGVDVRLSSYMEADEVLAEEPDAVIVATGSFPRMDGVQISNPGEPIVGMDQPHILSSHDLFRDHGRSLGQNAVVIDETGHFEAIAVAEYLQSQGLAVTYVTRHHGFAPSVEQMAMAEPALIRLSRGDFRLMTRSRVIAVDKQSVTVGPIYLPRGSNRVETVPADTVVMVSFNTANREIADALAGSGIELHLAGDAVSARHLPGAIRDGHLAGMAV